MKVTVISDTHGYHKDLELTAGDVLVHCGDFSHRPESVFAFVKWLGEQPFEHKILIAGNHDTYVETVGYTQMFDYCKSHGVNYLQDTSVIINGIKFYGTPWTPMFMNWAFMRNDDMLDNYWDMIPSDTDVLITHGPAYGIADKVLDVYSTNSANIDKHVGSKTLLHKIQTLDLKYHLFGHIHECYGEYNLKYKAINASIFDYYNNELNSPISFEI
jgi:Icc-related predicted phosphoesterase